MAEINFDTRPFVAQAKRSLCEGNNVAAHFTIARDNLRKQVDIIADRQARCEWVVPEVSYESIRDNTVSRRDIQSIRERGCVIARGVFPRQQAEEWNQEVGHYLEANDYYEKAIQKAGMDNYFGDLKNARPQIFGVYWSRPQVLARQAESMANTKRFLNRLWDTDAPSGPEFDAELDYSYADRMRRRAPGDATLGLSPHMDAGSYERWTDPAFQKIYADIFSGNLQHYDPWRAAYRTQTRELAAPGVSSMFRTFQGWTALTEQGPGDGTLEVLPVSNAIAYILLRALQDDVPDNELCLAHPGKALGVDANWHPDLMPGLISIQTVAPGDTVWWHPDVVHAVGNEHHGDDFASVIYIAASPACAKNKAYALQQRLSFQNGTSAPDFTAEDYEVDFIGRATTGDLTELGKVQMAIA